MNVARVPAVALIAAAAWVILIGETFAGGATAGHGQLCGVQGWSFVAFGEFMLSWSIMVAAMMLPDLAIDLRECRSASNPAGLGLFLVGFFAVWETFGCVVLAAGGIAQGALETANLRAIDSDARGAALLGLVAVAQFTSTRFLKLQRTQAPPHQPSLAAMGVRGGLAAGGESLRCCWGIMILMMAAKLHDPVSVAAFTLLVAYVRHGRFGIPAARLVGVAALADALVALTMRTSPL